jgi:hypothetical protein
LNPQSADDEVRAIHELDVVLPVAMIGWPREQWRFAFGGANDNGPLRRAFRGDGAASVLRIRSAVQQQLVARLQRAGQSFKLFFSSDNSRTNFVRSGDGVGGFDAVNKLKEGKKGHWGKRAESSPHCDHGKHRTIRRAIIQSDSHREQCTFDPKGRSLYSPLRQINRSNVAQLKVAWRRQFRSAAGGSIIAFALSQ